MKIRTDKRGSILVEAVLIVPLIIIISVMMICVSIYMYVNTLMVSNIDRETRLSAGSETNTVFYTGVDEIQNKDSVDIIKDYTGNTEMSRVYRRGCFFIKADIKNRFEPGVKWFKINENICSISCPEINECKVLWRKQYGAL